MRRGSRKLEKKEGFGIIFQKFLRKSEKVVERSRKREKLLEVGRKR
jgi:hypothetical protein